jgi:RNA polymerase sigma-70 factor (ECF subfamily)
MDDQELVRQALAGCHTAYADLVVRYTPKVQAWCQAHVRRRDAIPDLVQETFVRGWQNLPTLKDADRFGPWLFGIARNLCRSWRQSVKNRLTPFSDLPRNGRAGPDPLLDPPAAQDAAADRLDDLRAEVGRLPRALRETLLLYYSSDRVTYQELARLLGVSPATINKRLTHARRLLRRRCRGNRAPDG